MARAIHALMMSPAHARSLIAAHTELRAYALPQGFAIVPLDDEIVDAIASRARIAPTELMGLLSQGRTLAEIETEYFGGSGEQRASMWSDGAALFSTGWRDGDAINEALRLIGVRAGASDEFDALELVRFRRYDDFEKATPL